METTSTANPLVAALLQMVDMARDGLALLDGEHRCIYANSAACVLLEISGDEVLGSDFLAHFVAHERVAIAELIAGGDIGSWCTVHLSLGEARAIEYELRRHVVDGRPLSLLALRDLTSQRQERTVPEDANHHDALPQEHTEPYRAIFESTIDGLVILEMDGTIVEANTAAHDMLGYARNELIGLNAVVLTPPEYLVALADALQGAIDGGPTRHFAASKAIRKDGSLLDVEARGRAFDFRGKLHVLAVMRDITEQIKAEAQLGETEEQYRSIFEATSDALIIRNLDGRIVEVNPMACSMYGYTYDEMIGLPVSALIHPADHGLILDNQRMIASQGAFRARATQINKDGEPFSVDVHGAPFTYKGEPHVLTVVRDITERVVAEERLREREEQYRSIFEVSSDGFAITDLETGLVVDANPAMCRMHGYTYEEIIGLHPTEFVHPDFHEDFRQHSETVKAGGSYRARSVDMRKDGTPFPVDVYGTTFSYNGKARRLAVLRDITEQVKSEDLLEQRVDERTRELSTLLKVSHTMSSTLQLQPLLQLILDQLEEVVEYAGASISLVEDGESRIVAFRGRGSTQVAIDVRFPLRESALFQLWQGNGPLIIDDVRHDDSPEAIAFRTDDAVMMDDSFSYVRSWMAVPMIVNESLVGLVTLNGAEPGLYTSHQAELVLGMARQAAIAIDNARLYEQTVQRSSELAALLDVSHNVASTLELQPLLDLILDQLNIVADNDGITLLEVRGDEFVVLLRRAPGDDRMFPRSYPTQVHGPIWDKLRRGEVARIGNVRGADPLARAYRETVGDFLNTSLSFENSFMAVPLMLKDRIIGLLGLSSARFDYYTPHHADIALAIAQQAAIAIENARLYEKAQEAAVLEERQRLSRELHDSVSQALYGIVLGAQTARTMAERDPARVIPPLDYIVSLAQTGMAEMRALIFELRPETLEQEGLATVLQKQADAIAARHGIRVTTELYGEPEVAFVVKEALYRIAQEALNNTVKHASATDVRLSLERAGEEVVLGIEDNGNGFDAAGSFPGHLGLHSMRERVERFGGALNIGSTVGVGTTVSVRIPLKHN